MPRFVNRLAFVIPLALILPACLPLALRMSPSLLPDVTAALFEECDPGIAERAMPSHLKLMEALLKSDPGNRKARVSLCLGFTGYSMFFLEEDDPARASDLYLRAMDYGVEALGPTALDLRNPGADEKRIQDILSAFGKGDLDALFWTTLAWNAWINLNLDDPKALAQLGPARMCIQRVLEIEPRHFHGLPAVLMGTNLVALPSALGGRPAEARGYFEYAMDQSGGRFLPAPFFYARYYAVRIQDKELFERLLEDVLTTDPRELKEVCLINAVFRRKAERLLAMKEELFL
ncbi:MAG: hypothetical protein JW821_13980 [Deltaproteobacteria bacterium]|nr:hypothetical protein [Deltaproteobacteria bacterium]